jgi:hypothetical protein
VVGVRATETATADPRGDDNKKGNGKDALQLPIQGSFALLRILNSKSLRPPDRSLVNDGDTDPGNLLLGHAGN